MISHSKPWITEDDIAAVQNVLHSNMIAKGEKTQEFERSVAKYVGSLDAIAVGSGTAALTLALTGLEIGVDDEVILPTYVCRSVLDAVLQVGAKPVFCDVGEYWNMTPATVAPHISNRTKAIILVHVFGVAADTEKFFQFNIPVIEDGCQAFGAEIRGKKVGSMGTMGVFSFHATKCLATGEGGMVTSANPQLMERMRKLVNSNKVMSPMSDMQSMLGINQLNRYESMLQRRRIIAEKYFEQLPNHLTKNIDAIKSASIFYRFPILSDFDFNEIVTKFENYNVAVRRGVDQLLHRHNDLADESFPNAAMLFKKTLSLPLYPALTDEELGQVLHAVREIFV